MDKKTTGMVATIASIVLCGCPGLFGLCFGGLTALAGFVPGSDIDIMGSSDPSSAIGTGIAMLCGSIIFIAIPIIVWFFTLRKSKEAAPISNEPFPPAS